MCGCHWMTLSSRSWTIDGRRCTSSDRWSPTGDSRRWSAINAHWNSNQIGRWVARIRRRRHSTTSHTRLSWALGACLLSRWYCSLAHTKWFGTDHVVALFLCVEIALSSFGSYGSFVTLSVTCHCGIRKTLLDNGVGTWASGGRNSTLRSDAGRHGTTIDVGCGRRRSL